MWPIACRIGIVMASITIVVLTQKIMQQQLRPHERNFRSVDDERPLLQTLGPRSDKVLETSDILDNINIDCGGLTSGDPSKIAHYENWTFSMRAVESLIWNSESRCTTIKSLFGFNMRTLSTEEKEYPLAYAFVVYRNIVQVLFQLSAFYHPQNEYCIAVSGAANVFMFEILQNVHDCFPNIHVMKRPPLQWGNFEIINSTYACLDYLAQSTTPWKYFQYLSGVDAPLKTNLEMVQILKRLNETANADIERFPINRIKRSNRSPPPLPLVKSSLSILLSRRTVDEMVKTPYTRRIINYLPQTRIPDEAFWVTLIGNPSKLPITGGFDAAKVLLFQSTISSMTVKEYDSYKEGLASMNAYISRYQVWRKSKCHGRMYRYSCLFGIRDIPVLLKQPHLVAHKFYIEYQPASYFCILKSIRQRTFSPVFFDSSPYAQIPYVELSRGVPFSNLSHPEWIMKIY